MSTGVNHKRRIIRQISKRMMLREDVVEDVINEFISSMIVETVSTGKFIITDFFSISSRKWKGFKTSNRNEAFEEHWRLKVRISANLRLLYKFFGPNSEYPNIITTKNYRKLLEIAKNTPKGEKPIINKPQKTYGNPFLED